MKVSEVKNSRIISGMTFGFSGAMLAASLAGGAYTGTLPSLFEDLFHILTSPAPLVTDYFALGSLSAAFLNASLCGFVIAIFMAALPGSCHANTLAGYFLVVAHAFYGLNLLNMLPCFLGSLLHLHVLKLDKSENLHVCMFSTCFAPFVGELLFRYTQGASYVQGKPFLTVKGVLLTLVFVTAIALISPAILPGAKAWHKGYNLYNGGLAYGILGFLIFNFFYKNMGVEAPAVPVTANEVYDRFGHSYQLFGNCFFITLFVLCVLIGWYLNGRSMEGLSHLFMDTGYQSNFAKKYGMPLCVINLGLYGLLFLVYINVAILLTDGAGFTGPTFGVIFAALTFTAMGQHVQNVWPIFLGFPILSLLTALFNLAVGGESSWTISMQSHINSIAFATGLCPITGRYGRRAGIAAGMLCAALCTSTSALHGGLMLYNGGFTTGIAALILLPILEHYVKTPRDSMKQYINLKDMMTLSQGTVPPAKEHSEQDIPYC